MIKTFEEYQTINEGVITDFLKRRIDKIINNLSNEQLDKLKIELLPYKDLSKEEILQKFQLKTNEAENLDPYGEEEWDEAREGETLRRSVFKSKLLRIIGLSSMNSFSFSMITGILWSLRNTPILPPEWVYGNEGEYSIGFGIVTILGIILYFLCKKLYRVNR
jgi:hypothetical protein